MILRRLLNYWKSILVIAVISYLSFAPPATFEKIPSFEFEDKLIHFLMYAGLAAVVIFDLHNSKRQRTHMRLSVIAAVVALIVFGGAVELIQQHYFAPRTAEWADWGCDIAGILIGWGAMVLLKIATDKSN